MKSQLTIILFWCCVWLCQEASTFKLVNGSYFAPRVKHGDTDLDYSENEDADTDQDTDEDDKNEIDYSGFLVRVKVKGVEYTGTLIDPKIAVADPKTKTEETEVCNYKGKECKAPEEVTIVDDIAFLKLPTYILEPMIIERDILGEECKAIGLSHTEPIDARVTNVEVLCTNCKDFDAVICGSRLAGIIKGDPHFKLVAPKVLRDKAGTPVDQDYEDSMNDLAEESNDVDDSSEGDDWLSMRKSSEDIATIPNSIVILTACLIHITYVNEL